jgi:hypothetical protein
LTADFDALEVANKVSRYPYELVFGVVLTSQIGFI